MTKVFAEWACESSVWQENVVKFLSNNKKYRVCGLEFGPTLLDYLYGVKESKQPNYTKNGLSITYSIAPVVAIISFASTRRATFTAAATLGVMLFGILITVAIDYQKTRRKDTGEVISQECCVRLLEGLDEAPKYWWWPWGKQIKDITITEEQINRAVNYNDYSIASRLIYSLFTNVVLHQFYVARLSYLYNYHKLGGKMVLGSDILNEWEKQKILLSKKKLAPETVQETYREENRLEETSRIDKLVKTIYRVDNKEMSLGQALDLL